MATTALIFRAPAVIAPNGIAKVYGAGIGGDTCNATGNGTNGCAGGRVAGSGTDGSAARCAYHGATGETIAWVGATTGKE
jgi:hypothetical protein